MWFADMGFVVWPLHEPPPDEILIFYALTQAMTSHPAPADLEPLFDRIETCLSADPVQQQRYEQYRQRLATFMQDHDPLALFENLIRP